MNKRIYIIIVLFLVLFLSLAIAKKSPEQNPININLNNFTAPEENQKILAEPISQAAKRVTKKPFGIKISPEDSPVSPERFSGYHTGVDFETFPQEQDSEIEIYAICSGPLIYKNYVSGYGGVAVQNCQINGQETTVLYGHLKLASVSAALGQKIGQSQQLAILGRRFSPEIDNERKHLHLSIHKGKDINPRGYVQNPSELEEWIDIITLLE